MAAAGAREVQALENYRQLVRSAFVDVQDAFDAQRTGAARREALADQADALADAYRLAQLRYDAGSSSYLEVLDASAVCSSQLDLVAAQSGELQAAVRLFQSLGGGLTAALSRSRISVRSFWSGVGPAGASAAGAFFILVIGTMMQTYSARAFSRKAMIALTKFPTMNSPTLKAEKSG